MHFLNPAFLWAGFAVLIPPIIHLFNFRRFKTVYFSDVRFLQNMRNITRKRSTLRQIILMLLRMLVIAMVVLAFAEPVVYDSDTAASEARKSAPPIIYIDNSQSMQAGAISGMNLETAKTKALEIVDAFPGDTEFLLITNDFDQRHNRLVKGGGIRNILQEIGTSPRVPTMKEVLERALMSLSLQDVEPGCNKSIFIISDFQKNICDLGSATPDSLLQINLVGIESSAESNISIDTVVFDTPYRIVGSEEQALVTVCNYGSSPRRNVPIRLDINGATKTSETFDINAYERKQIAMRFVNTSHSSVQGRISIADSPIYYDNDLYFSYKIDSIRNVLIIGSHTDSKYMRALLGRDGSIRLKETDNIDNTDLRDFQTVILCQMPEIPREIAGKIQAYVQMGGNAIFVPAERGSISSYNYLLSLMECNQITQADTIRCKVSNINTQSRLLRGAIRQMPDNPDLPYITRYYNSMSNSYDGEEIVLETDSYKKVMTSNAYRAGKFFVFYTPLCESCGNLATHRIIVPLIYNAASTSQNFGQQYYSVIGRDNGYSVKLPPNTDIQKIMMKDEESGNEYIPRISGPDAYMNYKVFAEKFMEKSGFMHLVVEGRAREAIAFNYDRKESQMDFLSAEDVASQLQGSGFQAVRVMDKGSATFASDAASSASTRQLWRIFVVLALIFALAEMAVARFM
ncbi:MAG: VWA domain-containing protein [Bacteroidales bacterium]|nr:VWA domain-containing protein [Bacteroidales bacterium]